MLLLRQKSNDPASSQQAHVAGRCARFDLLLEKCRLTVLLTCRNIAQDAETMRRQVLGNPQVMADLRRVRWTKRICFESC